MRTFIAIEISEETRQILSQIQTRLKYSGADVKWVAPGNIHLTLKFLGEITEKKAEEVKMALDKIGKDMKSFEISLKDAGAFPRIEYPRVIWVGLDKGSPESKILAGKIDEELSKIGFEKESRPFAAHLTIGRVRSPKNKSVLKEKIETIGSQSMVHSLQIVSSVILFQSTLTPHESIYSKIHEAKLAG